MPFHCPDPEEEYKIKRKEYIEYINIIDAKKRKEEEEFNNFLESLDENDPYWDPDSK